MRIVEYNMELSDGYVITNDFAAKSIKDSPGDPEKPGIRMSLEGDCTVDDAVKSFTELDPPCEESPDFAEGIRKLLCGGDSDWKLVRVEVGNAQVSLCFWNEIIRQERKQLAGQFIKHHAANRLPEYRGYADALSLSPHHKFCLRFEVPLPDGSGSSTTLVEARNNGDGDDWLTVTEIGSQSRKIWRFTGQYGKENDEGREADIVHVVECTW